MIRTLAQGYTRVGYRSLSYYDLTTPLKVEGGLRSREYDGSNGKVQTYEILANKIEVLAKETQEAAA